MIRLWGGGINLVRPDKKTAEIVESYIYKQLNNSLSKSERQHFRNLVNEFIETNNLDVVILGCTELPLVYGNSNNPKIIDTLKILCDSLLEKYFKNKIT